MAQAGSERAPLLAALPVCSVALALGLERMVDAASQAQFPVELMEKDLRLFGTECVCSLPVTSTTLGVFQTARMSGLGQENLVAVYKMHAAKPVRE